MLSPPASLSDIIYMLIAMRFAAASTMVCHVVSEPLLRYCCRHDDAIVVSHAGTTLLPATSRLRQDYAMLRQSVDIIRI